MNFKRHLVVINGSIQAFGFGSSSIQTEGFQGERGCRAPWTQRGCYTVPSIFHPPGWRAFLPCRDLQAPLFPPSLCVAPATASEEEEDCALG